MTREQRFPLGPAVTLEQLEAIRIRCWPAARREPVPGFPALGGWLVTRYDLAVRSIRDAATFTVDDPRFSTAQVIGPSMLTLDGAADRHRAPFAPRFARSRCASGSPRS